MEDIRQRCRFTLLDYSPKGVATAIFSFLFLITFLFIAGCGGGGGGDSGGNTQGSGGAANINLAWDASSTSDVSGYKIHYGTVSGNYSTVVDVGNAISYALSNLHSGVTYFFAVTSYDSSGQESDYSNEISWTAR